MASLTLAGRIADRAARCGLAPGADLTDRLASYLELLGRWNRKINLTALPLDPPSDASIDRLVIEALVAVSCLPSSGLRMLDIGSGSGSPAIPIKLALPETDLVMVESRQRKSAFLREAVRVLGLVSTRVETVEFGCRRGGDDLGKSFDIITLRAVSLSSRICAEIGRTTKLGSRLLLFGDARLSPKLDGWSHERQADLPSSGMLLVLKRE